LAIYASHYDPDFFPEPDTFRPERFLKENADQLIPYTWRPFGAGNRVCIGQRFAINEMKIFMAKLINKFQIIDTPETKLTYSKGDFLMSYPEIIVKLNARN
jgi:cytochrome P450